MSRRSPNSGTILNSPAQFSEKAKGSSRFAWISSGLAGRTAREAKKMFAEAVALYLETCFENNLPYVRPVPGEEEPRLRPLDNFLELFPLKVNFKVRSIA